MVSKLSKEFALKTEPERRAAYADMLLCPVMHTDCTNAKINGKDHQECLAHVLRYLKASIENEPDRTWNKEMRSQVQEMIHFRNKFSSPEAPDTQEISGSEQR